MTTPAPSPSSSESDDTLDIADRGSIEGGSSETKMYNGCCRPFSFAVAEPRVFLNLLVVFSVHAMDCAG